MADLMVCQSFFAFLDSKTPHYSQLFPKSDSRILQPSPSPARRASPTRNKLTRVTSKLVTDVFEAGTVR